MEGKSILDMLRQELKSHSDAMSKDFSAVRASVSQLSEDFRSFGTRLSTVETTLTDVTERLEDVEGKVLKLEHRPSNSPGSSSDILSEWEERHKRKCNAMIFGVGEARGADRKDDTNADRRGIAAFVSMLLPGAPNPAVIRHSRIGKLSQVSAISRPVKVTFATEELASSFIKAAMASRNELQAQEVYRDVRVTFDRTKLQLEEYKVLRKALDARLAKGETNLRIIYRNGTPKILATTHPQTGAHQAQQD